MTVYEKMFHGRPVLSPKVMHFPFFIALGFQFHNHMTFQGLRHFLEMKLSYYEDLVRVFYTNLKFTPIGDLSIEICLNQIEIRQMVWMNIANVKYDGVKLTLETIPEGLNFDRALALSSMIREEERGQNVINVGSLNMNDRPLHYTCVHMFCPRDSNFSHY